MVVTEQDVADAAGVSRRSVSMALSENPRYAGKLRSETRRRIIDAVERLEYRPNRAAQLMRGKRSGLIGLITTASLLQVHLERLHAVSLAIQAAGYGMLSSEMLWTSDAAQRAVDNLLDARVEGVLLMSVTHPTCQTEVKRFLTAGIPVVSLGGARLPGVAWVGSDNHQGMRDLTRHLLDHGYRRLAYLTTVVVENDQQRGFETLTERTQGFQEAMTAAGLKAPVLTEPVKPLDWDRYATGRMTLRRLLKVGTLPEALLCANDELALGVLAGCAEAGLRVPGDLAVTGFDDTYAARNAWPPLTSVAQPNLDCGRQAVDWLLQLIRECIPPEHVDAQALETRLPCKVRWRASSDGGLRKTRSRESIESRGLKESRELRD